MERLEFKFKPVDAGTGHELGFFSSEGSLDEDELVLGTVIIPLSDVYQTLIRHDRLMVVYAFGTGTQTYTIAPGRGTVNKLKETIDRLCSYRWAENRRTQLEKEGRGAAFRTEKCPRCTAVVDLTGFAETPQFYCPYCEAIVPADGRVDPAAAHYRPCDQCKFYCAPVTYLSFYAVLNVAQWGTYSSCHVCMRRDVYKMLVVNLLPPWFGWFIAVYQAARAFGAGRLDANFPELVSANAYGNRGKVARAKPLYEAMLQRVGEQAGLRYNLALSYSRASEWAECLEAAEAALADCSNYTPAGTLVSQALEKLEGPQAAEQFLKTWGVPEGTKATPRAKSEQFQEGGAPGGREEGIRNADGR